MPDGQRRQNIHAVLLRIVAVLFGLGGANVVRSSLGVLRWGGPDATVLFLGWVVFAALWFAIAYGLWRLRRWARWGAIGMSALHMPRAALEWLTPYPERSPWSLVLAAVGIVVIVICVRRPRP
jgi:hypothetical protein